MAPWLCAAFQRLGRFKARRCSFLASLAASPSGARRPSRGRPSLRFVLFASLALVPSAPVALARSGIGQKRRPRPSDKNPKNHKELKSTPRFARPHKVCPALRFLLILSHGGQGSSLRFARCGGTQRARGPDSPRTWECMKTQRVNPSSLCPWCGEPVGRLHMVLTGPSIAVGEPHRWVFCSLLCLQRWVVAERALPVESEPEVQRQLDVSDLVGIEGITVMSIDEFLDTMGENGGLDWPPH